MPRLARSTTREHRSGVADRELQSTTGPWRASVCKPAPDMASSSSESGHDGAGLTPEIDFGSVSLFPPASTSRPLIQARLAIDGASSPAETEAERAAFQVMDRIDALEDQGQDLERAAGQKEPARPGLGSWLPPSDPGPDPVPPPRIRTRPAGTGSLSPRREDGTDAGLGVSPGLEGAISTARGGGRPLTGSIRTAMQHAFDADFSRVRIHDEARGDELSRSIKAYAFTAGSDVFFRRESYRPDEHQGRSLLAHELAHVVQQRHAPVGPGPATVQRLPMRQEVMQKVGKEPRTEERKSTRYKQVLDLVDQYTGETSAPMGPPRDLKTTGKKLKIKLGEIISAADLYRKQNNRIIRTPKNSRATAAMDSLKQEAGVETEVITGLVAELTPATKSIDEPWRDAIAQYRLDREGWEGQQAQLGPEGALPSRLARMNAYRDKYSVPGSHAPLGRGQVNQVFKVDYTPPGGSKVEGVFKPLNNTFANVVIEETLGIDENRPNYGGRNVATSVIAELLHIEDVVKTRYAMREGKLGIVMERVKGVHAQSVETLTENDPSVQEPLRALELRNLAVKTIHADKDQQEAAQDLMMKARRLNKAYETQEKLDKRGFAIRDASNNPIRTTMLPHVTSGEFNQPAVKRSLMNLQLLDAITAQGDRHVQNYLLVKDEAGSIIGVKGIDNDFAFGAGVEKLEDLVGAEGSNFTGMPPFLDEKVAQRVLELDPAWVRRDLENLLKLEEIEATVKRLDQVKGVIESWKASGGRQLISSTADWNRVELTDPTTSYFARDYLPLKELEPAQAEFRAALHHYQQLQASNPAASTGEVQPAPVSPQASPQPVASQAVAPQPPGAIPAEVQPAEREPPAPEPVPVAALPEPAAPSSQPSPAPPAPAPAPLEEIVDPGEGRASGIEDVVQGDLPPTTSPAASRNPDFGPFLASVLSALGKPFSGFSSMTSTNDREVGGVGISTGAGLGSSSLSFTSNLVKLPEWLKKVHDLVSRIRDEQASAEEKEQIREKLADASIEGVSLVGDLGSGLSKIIKVMSTAGSHAAGGAGTAAPILGLIGSTGSIIRQCLRLEADATKDDNLATFILEQQEKHDRLPEGSPERMRVGEVLKLAKASRRR
ncbi:MAG: DUF4157 domain-containing protein [Isosphaeraceae bacterium]